MAKFQVGDQVKMVGVPFVVEVLEIGTCEENMELCASNCPLGPEVFRFEDPAGLGDDWGHSSEFELVP